MLPQLIRAAAAGLLLTVLALGNPAVAGAESSAETGAGAADDNGSEATVGITSRAQALIIFDGRGDRRLAVMLSSFKPSPQLFYRTPFRLIGDEPGQEGGTRTGYYWKFTYNRFRLDRQEDPDTGGIGPSSPVYHLGTEVTGDFLTVAPVFAIEQVTSRKTVAWRLEAGMGAGYLALDGDAVLGDPSVTPTPASQSIGYSGPALFIFTAAQYFWKRWLVGMQMGISATSSTPYSFSQSFIALDLGYRVKF